MISPRTLWVAFPSMLGGYEKICDLADALGFDAIAPRAGEGLGNGSFAPSLKPAEVAAMKRRGKKVYPWTFSRPQAVLAEVLAFGQYEDAGADAVIIDAELPWDNDPSARDHAKLYGEKLRGEVMVPIYDAPWPAIAWHPGYPEAEFRSFVDGRLVQAYWTEIGWSARKTLDVMRAQWEGKDDRLLPIGVTYGRKEMARWGSKKPPPGEITEAELRSVAAEITGGWYSAEAAGPGVLAIIADSISPAPSAPEPGPTLPETPASLLASEIRSEQAEAPEDCTTFYCRNRVAHDLYCENADTDPP